MTENNFRATREFSEEGHVGFTGDYDAAIEFFGPEFAWYLLAVANAEFVMLEYKSKYVDEVDQRIDLEVDDSDEEWEIEGDKDGYVIFVTRPAVIKVTSEYTSAMSYGRALVRIDNGSTDSMFRSEF